MDEETGRLRRVRVESFPLARHVEEQRGGLEARGKAVIQFFQLLDDRFGAQGIHVAERTTTKWREANPEDSADVSVLRGPQHAFLEAPGRLVDHREHRAA